MKDWLHGPRNKLSQHDDFGILWCSNKLLDYPELPKKKKTWLEQRKAWSSLELDRHRYRWENISPQRLENTSECPEYDAEHASAPLAAGLQLIAQRVPVLHFHMEVFMRSLLDGISPRRASICRAHSAKKLILHIISRIKNQIVVDSDPGKRREVSISRVQENY